MSVLLKPSPLREYHAAEVEPLVSWLGEDGIDKEDGVGHGEFREVANDRRAELPQFREDWLGRLSLHRRIVQHPRTQGQKRHIEKKRFKR